MPRAQMALAARYPLFREKCLMQKQDYRKHSRAFVRFGSLRALRPPGIGAGGRNRKRPALASCRPSTEAAPGASTLACCSALRGADVTGFPNVVLAWPDQITAPGQ
ncbi:hypothetical protein SBBP1_560004 [Burkholderiales bacterium]|nr:hypothetical protein SBBP1_560004 [Burkholderiales bacterium]